MWYNAQFHSNPEYLAYTRVDSGVDRAHPRHFYLSCPSMSVRQYFASSSPRLATPLHFDLTTVLIGI